MEDNYSLLITEIRSFNRFYTKILGLINQHILDSQYSLTEARVLFEINNIGNCTANILIEELGIDRGYISRILKRFEADGLIYKKTSSIDRRAYILHLTLEGKQILSNLTEKSNKQIQELVSNLKGNEQKELTTAMRIIENKLSSKLKSINIRTFQPKDIEHILKRHEDLYKAEYGFDSTFVEYVANGIQTFLRKQNKNKENIWVAEYNGIPVGSIAIVKADNFAAQLRWLLIEPEMRGKGLGSKLIKTAISFCKENGYKLIFLWTLSILVDARNLYRRNGFITKETVEHDIWGKYRIEERWDLPL